MIRPRAIDVARRRAPSCPPLLGPFAVLDADGNSLGSIDVDDLGDYTTDQGDRGSLMRERDADGELTGRYTFQEPPSPNPPPQPGTTEWGILLCPSPHTTWHWIEMTGQQRNGTISPII